MGFFRDVNPKRAAIDFVDVWQTETPHRWRILALSVALSASFFIVLIPKTEKGELPRPDVTYITTFDPDRTDDEIIASNITNQERQDAIAERRAAREERIKDLYRALGRATGVDVDRMEREIAEEEARAAAEAEAERAAMTNAVPEDTE